MLIDEVKIKINAGDGGKGAVKFNKNLMSLGPAGGSGGKGGDVYGVGVSDLSALGQFRFRKDFSAEHGKDGRGQFRDGSDGEDLILKLPIGTVIHNLTNNSEIYIEKIGEQILIAKGGIGGKGNFHFRSPRVTSPMYAQSGKPGASRRTARRQSPPWSRRTMRLVSRSLARELPVCTGVVPGASSGSGLSVRCRDDGHKISISMPNPVSERNSLANAK